MELFGNKDGPWRRAPQALRELLGQYAEQTQELLTGFPLGQPIIGESAEKAFIQLFGQILRLENILASFDDFAGAQILTDRQRQDYRSVYLDLHAQYRHTAAADKEIINDDVVFEIELIKQVEINVDYILMLVAKFRQEHGDGDDRELRAEITRAIDASPTLRNKKDLIEDFVDSVSVDGAIDDEWQRYVTAKRDAELSQIIDEERLRPDAAHAFLDQALREGALRTAGTAITTVLPPVSRFATNNGHGATKQRVINKITRLLRPILRAQHRQLNTTAADCRARQRVQCTERRCPPPSAARPLAVGAFNVPVKTHLWVLLAPVRGGEVLVEVMTDLRLRPIRDRGRVRAASVSSSRATTGSVMASTSMATSSIRLHSCIASTRGIGWAAVIPITRRTVPSSFRSATATVTRGWTVSARPWCCGTSAPSHGRSPTKRGPGELRNPIEASANVRMDERANVRGGRVHR